MTNYVRMTLELETSNEIARRPRQSHWYCEFTFLPPVFSGVILIGRNYFSYGTEFYSC